MNKLTAACLLALSPALSMANIIPTGTTITGGPGNYTWTYDLQLSSDQDAVPGTAPTVNPVTHTDLSIGSFLTLYDFAGYIDGSCTGPANWVCSAQSVGFTSDNVSPIDNPSIMTITWAYTSGPTLSGAAGLVSLGNFSALSSSNLITLVEYNGHAIKNNGASGGTAADNVGSARGPLVSNDVPEPATMALAGLGFVPLGLKRWTVKPEA